MTTILILSAMNLAIIFAFYYKTKKKSEPTYTEKDITSFGNYLLSDRIKQSVFSSQDKEEAEEAFKSVSHANYENWKHKNKK